MAYKEQLQRLAAEKNTPCVTISLNTHRTHPDNLRDEIVLKNLLKEAEERIIGEYGKRPAEALLEKLSAVSDAVDINHNLDSLHLFISNDTLEIVKSPWPSAGDQVQISDTFAVRPLIKAFNRSEEYLIMLLSQSGVKVYVALNDGILEEVRNQDFPMAENRHYTTHSDKGSDSKHVDDLVREFLNQVDKALVRLHKAMDLKCVVVCTPDNYAKLHQVADKPDVYLGNAAIDYNHTTPPQIVKQTWPVIRDLQHQRRKAAIGEVKEAVSHGKVITDLQEIYQAALDGRGDLLIVHQDFAQPVIMKDERTFTLVDNASGPNTIDDITSLMAWEVISRNGRVIFTTQEDLSDLGNIVLKTRY